MKYKIHVNGTIQDEKTGFECGLDIAVTNGGSVENIGKALQGAVDALSAKAEMPEKSPEPGNQK